MVNGHPLSLELRLRERIDELSDQRDAALEDLWKARDRIDHLERRLHSKRRSLLTARNSRDMWHERWSSLNRRTKHLRSYFA